MLGVLEPPIVHTSAKEQLSGDMRGSQVTSEPQNSVIWKG
jgi:hypothetical protein